MSRKSVYSEDKHLEVFALHKQGASYRSIAKSCDLPLTAVWRMVKRIKAGEFKDAGIGTSKTDSGISN